MPSVPALLRLAPKTGQADPTPPGPADPVAHVLQQRVPHTPVSGLARVWCACRDAYAARGQHPLSSLPPALPCSRSFGPSIQHLMKQYDADKVFVMTHPRTRAVVESKLRVREPLSCAAERCVAYHPAPPTPATRSSATRTSKTCACALRKGCQGMPAHVCRIRVPLAPGFGHGACVHGAWRCQGATGCAEPYCLGSREAFLLGKP
jgi:hypothetical protein